MKALRLMLMFITLIPVLADKFALQAYAIPSPVTDTCDRRQRALPGIHRARMWCEDDWYWRAPPPDAPGHEVYA